MIFNIQVFGQEILNSMVVSSKDTTPLPFVHIYLINTTYGTFSDHQGQFSIKCSKNDTLIVSSIGFKKLIRSCNSIVDTLFLDEDVSILNEIIVRTKKNKLSSVRLGYDHEKGNGTFHGLNAAAVYIENCQRINGTISKVFFNLNKEKRDSGQPKFQYFDLMIRLRLFTLNHNVNGPGSDLLKKNIISQIDSKKKKIVFDIQDYNIKIPKDGIYVGIEFLGYYVKNKFVPFNSADRLKFIQYKPIFSSNYNSANSWIREKNSAQWKPFINGPEPYHNFNFGIEVVY